MVDFLCERENRSMDGIATRLKETSEECIKAYDAWSKDKKDIVTREPLSDAVHDLRKVAARIEIELAVTERDEQGRPMPIPGHRSRGAHQGGHQQGGKNNNRPPLKKPVHKLPPRKSQNKNEADNGELPAFISGNDAPKDGKDAGSSSETPKRAPRRRTPRATSAE